VNRALRIVLLIFGFLTLRMVAQVPVPGIQTTAPIGAGGVFPFCNFGTINFATDANLSTGYPQTSACIIKLTSSVALTATRTLTAPVGLGFSYRLFNATTGGQIISVCGVTGGCAAVPNDGHFYDVASDGVNYTLTGSGSAAGVSSITGPSTTATGGVTFTGGVTQSGNTFNFSGCTPTLSTTGTSGPATLTGCAFNIPQYVAPSGAYFLTNPSATQTVTIPSGYYTQTNQNNYADQSLTQDLNLSAHYGSGWNNPSSLNGNSNWMTIVGHGVNQMCANTGICDWTSGAFTHPSPGDTFWDYGYLTAWGGCINGNDECVGGDIRHVDQIGTIYGNATATGTALSSIAVTGPSCFSYGNGCTQNAYNWQQFPVSGGLLNNSQPVGTYSISANTTVDGAIEYTLSSGAVTPSTAIGTVALCSGSLQGKYGVYGAQTCSVNVVSGSFASGTNVCHIGAVSKMEEAGSVTVTGSGSTQSVTMQAMFPWAAGEFVGQGGPCGDYIQATNGQPIVPAYFVGGALDSTHLLIGNCAKGQTCGSGGNIILPNTTTTTNPPLSRSGGTVTALPSFGIPNLASFPAGTVITITGYTPSDLNGTFTVLTNSLDTYNPSITWAQSGATETSSVQGTISLPPVQITMYPGAMICGNPTFGTAGLCTNHMAITSGDDLVAVETSQFTAAGYGVYISQSTPNSSSLPTIGNYVNDQGPAPLGYAYQASNLPSYGPSLAAMNINGSYGNVFNINYRPANNGALLNVHANEPVSSNAKPYTVFQDGSSAYAKLLFTPSTTNLLWYGAFSSTSLTAIGAAATTSSGQVSYGGTTVAASNCGSLSGSAGCLVISVSGVQRYVPYW